MRGFWWVLGSERWGREATIDGSVGAEVEMGSEVAERVKGASLRIGREG